MAHKTVSDKVTVQDFKDAQEHENCYFTSFLSLLHINEFSSISARYDGLHEHKVRYSPSNTHTHTCMLEGGRGTNKLCLR